jgi:hypothetical protein
MNALPCHMAEGLKQFTIMTSGIMQVRLRFLLLDLFLILYCINREI